MARGDRTVEEPGRPVLLGLVTRTAAREDITVWPARRESDGIIVAWKPGNAGGAKDPN